MYQFYIKLSQT